ncbi:unnamed protein product [Polarella glacialis]|uniref:Uncharacterized protein n=1 Tax=Polarella glacialis TaxID=89957 RepID=A0A813HTZ5_POLGL|nr:unnamed protein product [Polarella glacialis]
MEAITEEWDDGDELADQDGSEEVFASLVAAVEDSALPISDRMLAAHRLLERFLHDMASDSVAGRKDTLDTLRPEQAASLVRALFDLMVEAERLPAVAVKVLWTLAAIPEAASALERSAGAVPQLLGSLRATEDPLLAGAALAVVAQIVSEVPSAAQKLFTKDGALLLRLLWRWRHELEVVEPLLFLFEVALKVPCHRSMLAVEARPAGRLPAALQSVAKEGFAAAAAAAAAGAADSASAWCAMSRRAERLAREWNCLSDILRPSE